MEVAGLAVAITLTVVSAYYVNNWTNQLTCEISDVTPVDSIASGGFFSTITMQLAVNPLRLSLSRKLVT